MTLTVSALSLNDRPLTQPVVGHFDAQGGTIGRGDQNTLSLPDPERLISRRHAQIESSQHGWLITNLSAANLVTVAGRTLSQGESAPMQHGDLVQIGGFLLEIRDDATPSNAVKTITDGRASVSQKAVTQKAAPSSGPRYPTALGPSDEDPFHALFGPALESGDNTPVTPAHAGMGRDAKPGPLDVQPGGLPATKHATIGSADPFDAWLTPSPAPGPDRASSPAAMRPGAAATADDPLASLAFSEDRSANGLLNTSTTAASDIDAFLAQPLINTQPSAKEALVDPRSSPLPASDHVPALQAAFDSSKGPRAGIAPDPPLVPPLLAAERLAVPGPKRPVRSPAAAAPPPSPDPERPARDLLWQSFCEGAGIDVPLPNGVNAELMRVLGSLMKTSVEGVLQLMSIRATTKQELRAQVTMIQAHNNNPLKFSPDVQSALEQLLQPPMRGFLSGPAAISDAMNDLVGHAVGTMAGMRAALEGVLQRFEPALLEKKLAASSVMDTLLPMNRRAKLWELYLQHFESIRHEAQDDFHALFGRAFVAAYEQQLDRLHEQQRYRTTEPKAATRTPASDTSRQPRG